MLTWTLATPALSKQDMLFLCFYGILYFTHYNIYHSRFLLPFYFSVCQGLGQCLVYLYIPII